MKLFLQFSAFIAFALSANGFVVDKRSTSSSSQLMASRRDFVSNTAAAVAVLVLPNVAGAATAEKEGTKAASQKKDSSATLVGTGSYTGVWSDPNHPKGYRVLVANGSSCTMTLNDGPFKNGYIPDTFNLPVKVKQDKKSGNTLMTFDFSPKGGPEYIVGTVGNNGNSISFTDGNVWKKNTGLEGVYKDGKSKTNRVIRKDKGSNLIVELRKGSSKNPTLLAAKSGASKKDGVYVNIDFPGKKSSDPSEKVKGTFNNGILSFPDGNTWTKL